jgi:hypothetical protein
VSNTIPSSSRPPPATLTSSPMLVGSIGTEYRDAVRWQTARR